MEKEEYLLEAVPPGKFEILSVDWYGRIDEFVQEICRREFRPGKGFYEFSKSTKAQLVRENTQVILRDKRTGEMFTGTAARLIIGVRPGERAKVKPSRSDRFDIFVQSRSSNRKLIADTRLLYEVKEKQNKKGW